MFSQNTKRARLPQGSDWIFRSILDLNAAEQGRASDVKRFCRPGIRTGFIGCTAKKRQDIRLYFDVLWNEDFTSAEGGERVDRRAILDIGLTQVKLCTAERCGHIAIGKWSEDLPIDTAECRKCVFSV